MSADPGPAPTPEPPPGPAIGSAAAEASRLFDALQDWARRAGATGTPAGDGAADQLATGAAECRLCPVCQLIALLRQTRPEVAGHLADAATSLLAAVRTVILTHEHQWAARGPGAAEHIHIG